MLPQLLWVALSFFAGALPFAVWVGRLVARRDIREVADHNPGATNVLRVAGDVYKRQFLSCAPGRAHRIRILCHRAVAYFVTKHRESQQGIVGRFGKSP